MGRISGITMYECDRCGAKEHLTDDSPSLADWHDVDRTTADGARRSVLMCSSCHGLYKKLVESEDASFNEFMSDGVPR